MSNDSLKKLWQEKAIVPETIINWHFGPLIIWCKSISDEIRIAYNRIEKSNKRKKVEPPDETEWSRFTVKQSFEKIHLLPVFPDRPVVLQTESPFKLTKGASTKIYIRVPLWIKVGLIGTATVSLMEIPSIILSNTWFGDFFEGQLCYWISTAARRILKKDKKQPYLAICPIELINRADKDLSVEKICLRVSGLSLFFDGEYLWADETKVVYKGGEKGSQITSSGKVPSESDSAELLSSPRQPAKKSFAAKTFSSFKDLPGLGIITS
jgi:hypothetical protein